MLRPYLFKEVRQVGRGMPRPYTFRVPAATFGRFGWYGWLVRGEKIWPKGENCLEGSVGPSAIYA